MSQVIKVLHVLNLFTENQVTWSAEEIAEELKISRPTAFRYVRQLCDAGMLTGLSGRYALGARIIQLDHRIRQCDPVLLASRDSLRVLAAMPGFSAILSSIYDDQVINVHHEQAPGSSFITFGRGNTMPLFRGAASKSILSHLTPPRLKRLYDRYSHLPDAMKLGHDWPSFSKYFREQRKRGYYVSNEEVDAGVIGIAAPIFNGDGLAIGSLTIAFEASRSEYLNRESLGQLVMTHCADVSGRIGAMAQEFQPA